MRITSIELAGASTRMPSGKPGIPRAVACIHRSLGDEFITVEILAPGLDRKHQVQPDDEQDQWSMAECLQRTLDGCTGTNSMVHEYLQLIQYFAD